MTADQFGQAALLGSFGTRRVELIEGKVCERIGHKNPTAYQRLAKALEGWRDPHPMKVNRYDRIRIGDDTVFSPDLTVLKQHHPRKQGLVEGPGMKLAVEFSNDLGGARWEAYRQTGVEYYLILDLERGWFFMGRSNVGYQTSPFHDFFLPGSSIELTDVFSGLYTPPRHVSEERLRALLGARPFTPFTLTMRYGSPIPIEDPGQIPDPGGGSFFVTTPKRATYSIHLMDIEEAITN